MRCAACRSARGDHNPAPRTAPARGQGLRKCPDDKSLATLATQARARLQFAAGLAAASKAAAVPLASRHDAEPEQQGARAL